MKKEALGFLQKALSSGFINVVEWIKTDPDFENFRSDPEFEDILNNTRR